MYAEHVRDERAEGQRELRRVQRIAAVTYRPAGREHRQRIDAGSDIPDFLRTEQFHPVPQALVAAGRAAEVRGRRRCGSGRFRSPDINNLRYKGFRAVLKKNFSLIRPEVGYCRRNRQIWTPPP